MTIKRVDKNQKEIVASLRKVGCSVFDTHTVGKGFPDLACYYRGVTFLVEVKDGELSPSRRKLTKDEEIFNRMWGGSVVIAKSVHDAINHVAFIHNKVTYAP